MQIILEEWQRDATKACQQNLGYLVLREKGFYTHKANAWFCLGLQWGELKLFQYFHVCYLFSKQSDVYVTHIH